MKDLVNFRLQKQKRSRYVLKRYPMIWIGIILFLAGLSGAFLFCSSVNTSATSISTIDCLFILVVDSITALGIILIVNVIHNITRNIDQNQFYTEEAKFSKDSLYLLLRDRVSITSNGYFIPNSPDTALLYLMLNRLLQYDIDFEFETYKGGDTQIVTGISKKHQSQVTLIATLVDATDTASYKNVRLTLNEKNK